MNPSPDEILMHWLQSAARDETFHGIKQFEPIFQGRIRHPLPLVKALLAVGEQPFAPHPLGVYL
jgi:hypothetical protein